MLSILPSLFLATLLSGSQDSSRAVEAHEVEPQWIWGSREPKENQSCWFFHSFLARGEISSAVLWTSCDNALELLLNGEPAAVSANWSIAVRRDVSELLRAGQRNRIAARGFNQGGPAGFWFELELEYADGSQERVVSDPSWSVSLEQPAGWRSADFEPEGGSQPVSFGELGVEPWGSPRSTFDGLPPHALEAEALELSPGFTAELLYSVPGQTQGSWVSLAAGPGGVLFASDQYGAIYEVTPSAPGAGAQGTRVRPLALEVGQAQGMLWAFDSLYFVGGTGGAGSGLYRAVDSDDDGELDEVLLLRELDGGGEHGPHAVRLAPDGQALYVIAGNHTDLPELSSSRVPTHWGEDQLLERAPDPRGHAVGVMAPGGWLCRVSPDGQDWELVASGMRNAYDFAFDRRGEVLTFDSDMEWDVGLAWYRPARLLHLVSGSDFGWRYGSGKWPQSYPDSWPGLLDVGLASPTGVEFAPAAFPELWRDSLLVADWAYGTIYAVHLQPAGASYEGRFEVFARGKPFAVTDMVASADGALYVTTGGRRTQSGLYRIRAADGGSEAVAPQARAEGSLLLRRRLELLHRPLGRKAVAGAWPHLGSADPFVRRAARVALEHQEPELWRERALQERDALPSLTALVALARSSERERDSAAALLQAWQRLAALELEPARQVDLLRLYALIAVRHGPLGVGERSAVLERLDPRFPSGDPELDRELCRALCELDAPGLAERALDLFDAAADQETRVHYLFTLRLYEGDWTPAARQRYFGALAQAIATFEGGASLRAYLENAREEALEGVEAGEREGYRVLEAAAKSALTPEAVPAVFVREWQMADFAAHYADDWSARDLERGGALLERATCLTCHRFGKEGGNTGPDLTGAGSRFSARDLLANILTPSATISDQYEETEILTVDDELLVGRVEEEDGELIWLRTLPPEEERIGIELKEILLRRPHAFSRMPEGLVNGLERDEVLDLLAALLIGPQ